MRVPHIVSLVLGLALLPLPAACQKASGSQAPQRAPGARSSGVESRDNIVRQAQPLYYSLRAHGLQEFRCRVTVDFDTMFGNLNLDATGRELLPMLKKVDFSVAVGPTGAISVSHQMNGAPATEALADRMRQSLSGFDGILEGFFQTWSQFVIYPPLPREGEDYSVEAVGEGYSITQKAGSMTVSLDMNREMVITHMEIASPKVNGGVDPVFASGKEGLLLTGYEAKVKDENDQLQDVSVRIGYQEVDNLQLPQAVTVAVKLPNGGTITAPINFMDCHATTK